MDNDKPIDLDQQAELMKKYITFEGFKQFIESICLDWMKLKLLDNEENDYIDFYSRVSLQDDSGYMYHNSYNSVYNSYKNKSNLIKFSKYNKYTIYNINHWIELNNKQLELLSTEFINNKHKLSWRCAERHEFESLFNNILKGHGCPYCAGQGRPTIEFVKEKFLENNYVLLSNEYKNNSTKLKYICKKHFDIGIQEIAWSGFYNQGSGCYYCGLEKRALSQLKTHEKYSEEVYNLVGDEYTVLGDYKKGNEYILMMHDVCGSEYHVVPNNFLRGSRCPQCAESRGEQIVREYLKDNNIKFLPEYTFDDLTGISGGLLRFDFAVFSDNNDLEFLIEYDGEFHYQDICEDGSYEMMQIHDQRKNQYCKDNNIPLLRIPYWEFDNIEKTLEEWLTSHVLLQKESNEVA